MKIYFYLVIAFLFVSTCLTTGNAQDNVKLAQTGMQFLSVVSDARAAALGNAVTTLPFGSASLFFNPALMAETDKFFDCAFSSNEWIAGIKHYTVSLSINPAHGDYGVVGLSFQSVNYGEIIGTVYSSNSNSYLDFSQIGLPNPNPTGLAIGVGYAKFLNDKFSIGGHIRLVTQDLGQSITSQDTIRNPADSSISSITRVTTTNKLSPLVFDFGTVFKTGFKSLTFGMSVRNFSQQVTYAEESFELPLTFTLGLSMDLMDFMSDRNFIHSLLLSVDAVHNRDYHEQMLVGLEVNLLDVLSLRAGYVSYSDESNFSYGLGLSRYGLGVDYAYTPFGVFDKVQRISIRFSM